MIIGIDIDDTLTELGDIQLKTVQRYLKEENLHFNVINPRARLITELLDWSLEECGKFWFKHGESMFEESVPKPNAVEVIRKLKFEGHTIIIVTARSNDYFKDAYKFSYDWLVKNNIAFDKLFVGHWDKTQTCLDNSVELFIDDAPDVLTSLKNAGIKTIGMKADHNEEFYNSNPDFVFADDWNEVYKLIKQYENELR